MTIKYQANNRSPSPVDIAVGKNIRTLRLAAGITQEKLAKAVGVSYQQLQKLETGSNRVTAGRLVQLADALGLHPADFFMNMSDEAPGKVWDKFDTLGETKVLRTFQCIACPKQKAKILALMETLAGIDD
jgi:transcriptional regulator with XRE-family HTH domain